MARQPRLYAPGFAQLISIQISRLDPLVSSAMSDQLFHEMINWLGQFSQAYRVTIHGWSLTPSCILLLASPVDDRGIPLLVQALGRKLAARLKTGTVFSGRYHSTIPQPGQWVLPTMLWLEYQACREHIVTDPEHWPWSSARAHTGAPSPPGASPAWLQSHPDYWLCGNTPFDRQAYYRKTLAEGLSSFTVQRIAASLKGQWVLGDENFALDLQKTATRRVSPGKRGRPKKQSVPI